MSSVNEGPVRELIYLGSSKKDLERLPREVQEVFVFALAVALDGRKHPDAVPMQGFGGASVLEVAENFNTDTYRSVYTVRYASAVYVLHVFKKESKRGSQLPREDRQLIETRLAEARRLEQERTKP